jgi:hypothetical protein
MGKVTGGEESKLLEWRDKGLNSPCGMLEVDMTRRGCD